ncbi:hypothetical protein HN51_008712, partial [Arachis hypogaea]
MTDLDRDDAGSEDANFLFNGHRARITCMRYVGINVFELESQDSTVSIGYTFSGGMFEMKEVK